VIRGVWESEGYGWILEFSSKGYALHHATALNCVAAERGSFNEFERCYDRINAHEEHLSLHQAGDLTRYHFRRIGFLPEVPQFEPGSNRDPALNFDSLWQQFREHYAFFGLHRVDWDDCGRRFRNRVTEQLGDDELFALCAELLQPLDDGHVTLAAGARHYQRVRRPDLREAVQAELRTPNGRITPRTTVDALAARFEPLLLAPFEATRTPLRRACNDLLSWCELVPGVGYLSVLRLFGFADTGAARRADDLPRSRLELAGFLRTDMMALESALDVIFAELRHCRSLVLDLRFNGGGFDRAGLVIARRLADRRRVAFAKRALTNKGFTLDQAMHVDSGHRPFSGPVVVLTSPLCVSAGEILVLALRALPQVTVLGESTAGMLSDNLIKPLPNGWELSLSNEVYTSGDGLEFEGRGIVPDVAAPVLDARQLVPVLHRSLAAAVELVEQGGVPAPRHRRVLL
jgi:carboxyl-terminal processing protease